jgi:mannose-6-phosphate isomerase
VAAGETYFLPAGTLHAIGAGIQLFETQQASDLTYRIFDWNRVGADGQPRQLHVAKAGDVLDYRATTRAAVEPLAFADAGSARTLLVGDRRFVVERLDVCAAGASIATHGLPITITTLSTALSVALGPQTLTLPPYATMVIPAAAEACAVRTAGELLIVRPSPALDILTNEAIRGGVRASEVERFLGQFA